MIEIMDMDERRHAARLLNAYVDANQAYEETADTAPAMTEAQIERVNAITREYQRRVEDARIWREEEMARIAPDHPELAAAERAADEAHAALDELPRRLMEDDEGRPVICAKSGAPIWDDEPVLEGDDDTVVIRALVLPDIEDVEEAA